jgi:predicted nucleotidyltransferase
VGGLAVSVRTRERFTKDVDFAVAVGSDREAEKLAHSLQERGLELLQVIEQDAKQVIATLRFRHPDDDENEPTVDLLFGSSGIEQEIVQRSDVLPIAKRVTAPVATIPHLIAMKVLSEAPGREHDRADLQVLLVAASPNQLDEAREALRLIEERGFHRDKDLQASLDSFVRQLRQ